MVASRLVFGWAHQPRARIRKGNTRNKAKANAKGKANEHGKANAKGKANTNGKANEKSTAVAAHHPPQSRRSNGTEQIRAFIVGPKKKRR